MFSLRRLLLANLILVFSCLAGAKDIKLGVGIDLPPYVLRESNSGIELDIAREALALQGHTITPVYLPFARVIFVLESGGVDGALTTNEDSGIINVYYSDSHIHYQNVAVSLSKHNLPITDVNSLGNYSVLAFQFATRYLGEEFNQMAKRNKTYTEKAQQNIQISMLYLNRVEVIVLDLIIFKYFKKLEKRVSTTAPVDVFKVFAPTRYKVGFKHKSIRDDFNKGLSVLRKSGRYDEIILRYTE